MSYEANIQGFFIESKVLPGIILAFFQNIQRGHYPEDKSNLIFRAKAVLY